MVMPSIFRVGTCFMGFSAWNSSENCGDKDLMAQLSRAEPGQWEDLRPAAPLHLPPLGKVLAPERCLGDPGHIPQTSGC